MSRRKESGSVSEASPTLAPSEALNYLPPDLVRLLARLHGAGKPDVQTTLSLLPFAERAGLYSTGMTEQGPVIDETGQRRLHVTDFGMEVIDAAAVVESGKAGPAVPPHEADEPQLAFAPTLATRENEMTVMTGWNLFEDMRAAQDEMLRATRGHGWRPGQQFSSGTTPAVWAPAVDIRERKNAYLVAVELPGVKVGDLEITFEDGLLTIQGERFAHDSAEDKVHRAERYYGAFRRSITVPGHVEADKIEASVQDGVLQIMVPKAPDVQAKRIQVRVGQGRTVLKQGAEVQDRS
jgi:HSP20 family protein